MPELIRERSVEEGVSYDLVYDWLDTKGYSTGAGFAFPCDKDGTVDMAHLQSPGHEAGLENYNLCSSGQMRDSQGTPIGTPYVRAMPWRHMIPAAVRCDACGGEAEMSNCGAWVCNSCENHVGLARCYCGWSASGGDGHAELLEMGETIEEDY